MLFRHLFLQSLDAGGGQDGSELGGGGCAEELEPLGLWQALLDVLGVHGFQVGNDDELRDGGTVTDIPLGVGMLLPPLFCRHAEEGDVDDVGLAGVCLIDEPGREWCYVKI